VAGERPNLIRCGEVKQFVDGYVDVIFVHGLTGDYRATWSSNKKDDSTFWPSCLEARLEGKARVWSLDYDAPLLKLAERGTVDQNFGTNAVRLLGLFEQREIGANPIVFITHSLGGLVVKGLLRQAADGELLECRRRIASNTRAVVFLAVPHCGSSLARLMLLGPLLLRSGSGLALSLLALFQVIPNLVLKGLPMLLCWIVRPSQSTEQLRDNNAELRDLAGWYRRFADRMELETLAFYETKRQLVSLVVTPCSADPGNHRRPVEPIAANHVKICKLAAPIDQAPLFGRMKTLIEDVHKKAESGTTYIHFEERIEPHVRHTLANPALVKLRAELSYRDAGGSPRIKIPEKFSDIPVIDDLRVKFEKGLRKSIRDSFADGSFTLSEADIVAANRSHFDIDTYTLDLWREWMLGTGFKAMRERFQYEAKNIEDNGTSLMPLFRPVRAIEHAIEDDMSNLLKAIRDVVPEINKRPTLDEGRQTRDLLERLENSLEAYHETHEKFEQIHRARKSLA
jgi:pimeloyl-ACP methyl ester carboxylesterase